jgi:hypothetical protein
MIKKLQFNLLTLLIILTGNLLTSQVWANPNLFFIFDVSERMSGKFPNHTKLKDLNKIDTATTSFEAMLEQLPKDINVGLVAYGHHGEKDCSAVEILSPLNPLNSESIMEKVEQLEPDRGSTPLAKALEQASEALSTVEGEKTIILFSDGIDTCGGDVEEVINQLKEQGVTVNILGIDIKEDEIEELSSLTVANEGHYYAVNNFEEMEVSLKNISEKIENKSFTKPFFRDDFIEKSLSKQWQVLNPDIKQLQVEKGGVTFNTTANNPKHSKNILRFDAPTEKSNWALAANFSVSPQALREVFELGITNKEGNQVILAQLNMNPEGNILLKGIKGKKKSTSSFQKKLITYKAKNTKENATFIEQHIQSITVKLEKVNMEYVVSAKLETLNKTDSEVSSRWVSLQKIKASPLPNDKFFIKAYAVNVNKRRINGSLGKIIVKWVDVKTM